MDYEQWEADVFRPAFDRLIAERDAAQAKIDELKDEKQRRHQEFIAKLRSDVAKAEAGKA